MFKSLRWRLQVWHALVLLVVLTSFGAIVYSLQWKTQLQLVDAELNRASDIVRRLVLRRRPRNRDEVRQETESIASPDPNSSKPQDSPRNDAEPERPSGPPDSWRERMNRDTAEFDHLFHGDEESRFYYVLWNDKGEVIKKSDSAPEIEYPQLHATADGPRKRLIRERRGDHVYRELIQSVMFERNLLVGQSLEKELTRHRQTGLLLAAAGLIILAAGTLGGGWLTARAIRPITAMTAAAESISAQNLSQRIKTNETDNEIGNLAKVLNDTFDRLQSAFERQKQFTADASHELRTPLSVIATHTELALSRPRSNEDYRAAIETCQRASKRMRTLIDSLLILARFDSRTPSLKQDRVDLEPLIHDCIDLVQPLAAERGIQIECQTSACDVLGDWDRLSQVVTNLLTNAIRYNVDGGRVIVSTEIRLEKAVISVTDTGIGIDADQLPRIFDRFYQVDKARSRAEGSCGLGLSICKTIVDAHGGTISVTSLSGHGTTIEVWLPRANSSVTPAKLNIIEEQLLTAKSES